jgi:hypothetical protein
MRSNDLRLVHFVAVTPATTARLRRQPSSVARLRDGNREETGLDRYWHGVQYLLAGRAKGLRGPLAWFTGGGENIGRTPAGPVRYLSPEHGGDEVTATQPPDRTAAAVSSSGAAVVLSGASGRRYDRVEGKPQTKLDETFAGLGYRPLGDMAILPVLADFVISNAFVLEKAKKRVFATMMSKAAPAQLEAALRERRAALEAKHGAAVVLPPELASAARAWEAWWAKQAG